MQHPVTSSTVSSYSIVWCMMHIITFFWSPSLCFSLFLHHPSLQPQPHSNLAGIYSNPDMAYALVGIVVSDLFFHFLFKKNELISRS